MDLYSSGVLSIAALLNDTVSRTWQDKLVNRLYERSMNPWSGLLLRLKIDSLPPVSSPQPREVFLDVVSFHQPTAHFLTPLLRKLVLTQSICSIDEYVKDLSEECQ